VLILVDPFTRLHRQRIIDFVAERHLPAIYESREFVDAGASSPTESISMPCSSAPPFTSTRF
jgi:hypothetical protein